MSIKMIGIILLFAAMSLGTFDRRGATAEAKHSGHANPLVAANGSVGPVAPLANRPPRVNRTIPNQTAREGNAFSYGIPAGTFRDPDGGNLRITAQMQSNWLSFNQSARRVVGIPLAFDSPVLVRVRATDQQGANATTSFQVRISPRPLGDETGQSTPSPDFDGTTNSTHPSISAEGRFVAHVYDSAEVDERSIVVRDFTFNSLDGRGSFTVAGPIAFGLGGFCCPSISANGSIVAFVARTAPEADLEVRVVRIANSEPLELETKFVQSIPALGDDLSIPVSLSGNGRFVAFERGTDIVVAKIGTRRRLVIRNANSPSLSSSGRRIAYAEITPSAERAILTAKLDTSRMRLLDTVVAGVDTNDDPLFEPSNPVVSADGRFVAFESDVSDMDLVPAPDDTNDARDIFVFNVRRNTLNLVSIDAEGDQSDFGSFSPSLSGDGSLVAFHTVKPRGHPGLVDGSQVLVGRLDQGERDGELRIVSIDSNGVPGFNDGNPGSSVRPSLSADGRFVSFESEASNLTPDAAGNQGTTVFLAPTSPDNAPVVDLPFDPAPDPPEDSSTQARLPLGLSTPGEIDPAFDADWYRIELTAGQVYRFALQADDSNGVPLDDPYLEIRHSDEVVADDDSGGGINNHDALLDYPAPVSGTFFIIARAYDAGTGDFLLTVSPLESTASR